MIMKSLEDFRKEGAALMLEKRKILTKLNQLVKEAEESGFSKEQVFGSGRFPWKSNG